MIARTTLAFAAGIDFEAFTDLPQPLSSGSC
jgi:hypothetical protein